jgi:hypothetical protein
MILSNIENISNWKKQEGNQFRTYNDPLKNSPNPRLAYLNLAYPCISNSDSVNLSVSYFLLGRAPFAKATGSGRSQLAGLLGHSANARVSSLSVGLLPPFTRGAAP